MSTLKLITLILGIPLIGVILTGTYIVIRGAMDCNNDDEY